MRAFVFFLLLLLHAPVIAQNNRTLLTPEQQKADFRIMVDALDAYHPSAYRFVSRDSLQRSAEAVIAGLDRPLSEEEFHLVVRRFVTQLHCGHTVVLPSEAWYAANRGKPGIIPVEPVVSGDKLYLPSALPSDSLAAGKEIRTINGRSAADILSDMRAIHSCDGYSETFADHSIAGLFQTYYLFLYGREPAYTITYGSGDETRSAEVQQDEAKPVPGRKELETYEKVVSNDWSTLYVNNADKMAVLRIEGFGKSKFKKQYRKVFRELKQRGIPNLVIDLRDNGGGYFPNGNRLLRYLSKEPFTFRFYRPKQKPEKSEHMHMGGGSKLTKSVIFKAMRDPIDEDGVRNYVIRCKPKKNRYDGRLYVLMNGGSFSMSGYVTSFLQHYTDALMIGEETGGGDEGSNGMLFYMLTLPGSKIRVNVPYYHLTHQLPNVTSDRGVLPDIPVSYSVEDRLSGADLELKTALSEIRKYNTYNVTKEAGE